MSKSICKAYKANKNDEMYTPRILVECLKPYFENWCITQRKNPSQIKVWAPFDKTTSEYAFFFQKLGCQVKCSHIDYGQDFFTYEPEQYDIIVSNPPFSRKLDVFKRCNELGKPWVMLMNTMALNYNEIGNYFADNPVELLLPDKRISFDGNPSSFNSCYVCKDFLHKISKKDARSLAEAYELLLTLVFNIMFQCFFRNFTNCRGKITTSP